MSYIGFDKLAGKTSPALAAVIGRRKYGSRRFNVAAVEGKSLRGAPVRRARRKSLY